RRGDAALDHGPRRHRRRPPRRYACADGCLARDPRRCGEPAPARPMILFDLDGTLVDTTDLILRSFRHAFDRHLPGKLPPREAIVATFGTSLPGVLTEMAAAEGHDAPEQMGADLLTTYREYQHQHHDTLVQPFPGVREMLATLKADGHRLGLVTSKMEGFARRGLRLVGLESFLEVLVFH